MDRVILYLYSMAGGGAEKVTLLLANEFVNRDFKVDLILIENKGPYLPLLDKRVCLYKCNPLLIKVSKIFEVTSVLGKILSFWLIVRKLDEGPILAVGEWPNLVAPITVKLFRLKRPTVISERNVKTFINAPEDYNMGVLIKWLARKALISANKIIAISSEVKNRIISIVPQLNDRVSVIYNPLNYTDILRLTHDDVIHPWIDNNTDTPVLIALGRLHPQKDYPTLLNALALLKTKRDVRLIIMGEGDLRVELEELSRKLGIANAVSFIGFQINPYKYLSKADLFVHSALFEGFGNVFIEALACGLPIVTTDCNTPNEIITQGVMGTIVPAGDYYALAKAIEGALEKEYDRSILKIRAQDFDISKIADQYITVLRNSSNEYL